LATLDILLGSRVFFQLRWHSIDGQILVHQVEKARLQLLKEFLTLLADESIIVLVLHMHDELHIALFGALRQGFHLGELDASLELMAFNIAKLMCCQQQVPHLLHSETIVLDNFA
jgi:hypothetical protein